MPGSGGQTCRALLLYRRCTLCPKSIGNFFVYSASLPLTLCRRPHGSNCLARRWDGTEYGIRMTFQPAHLWGGGRYMVVCTWAAPAPLPCLHLFVYQPCLRPSGLMTRRTIVQPRPINGTPPPQRPDSFISNPGARACSQVPACPGSPGSSRNASPERRDLALAARNAPEFPSFGVLCPWPSLALEALLSYIHTSSHPMLASWPSL